MGSLALQNSFVFEFFKRGLMSFPVLQAWLFTVISVEYRLKIVCCWYLFSLMPETRKHSLEAAAKLSDLHKSQFSRFLKNHSDLAVNNLNRLSRRQARHDVKLFKRLKKEGPASLDNRYFD